MVPCCSSSSHAGVFAVFLLHKDGAVAVLSVTVTKQIFSPKALKNAILLDPGQIDGWRQMTLVEVLLGLDS
jgi:hypothetical protein